LQVGGEGVPKLITRNDRDDFELKREGQGDTKPQGGQSSTAVLLLLLGFWPVPLLTFSGQRDGKSRPST
jgi:hypothetical protein